MSDIFVEPMWAIVELMGRQVVAGQVSEVNVAGTEMLRVDVPAVVDEGYGDIPAYTKFFGGGAIYGITPVDELGARAAVLALRKRPVQEYVMSRSLSHAVGDAMGALTEELDLGD